MKTSARVSQEGSPSPEGGSPAKAGASLRRSDRISVELAIDIGGTDARGTEFFESARTFVVSKHGAKIECRPILSPGQEILICCKASGKEAPARVVGDMGESSRGHFYGVAFLDDQIDLWDIEFPQLTESERAEARVLLECAACHQRKVTYLTAVEAEVLEFHRRLSFFCKRCMDATVWRPVSANLAHPEAAAIEPPVPLERPKDKRTARRTRIRVSVCLRHPQLGEEIVETEDLSRGGFGFRTRKFYNPGVIMDAALPFAPGQANIFSPVEIRHCEPAKDEGWFTCGVAYVRVHLWWPG